MPIKPEDLRNFYLGTGVESFVMAQFQVLNCNAEKLIPDFGFDIHVTNLAAYSYLGAKAIDIYIQVKSRIYSGYQQDGIYSFSLSKTDYSLIQNTPNSVVVFVIAKPRIQQDPLSFDEDRAQFLYLEEQIESSAIEYLFNASPKDARSRKGYSEVADKIKGYDFSYIWCNSNHLDKLIQDCGKEYSDNYAVNLSVSEELQFYVNSNPIVPEMHDIWFLVNNHDPMLDENIYPWWVDSPKDSGY